MSEALRHYLVVDLEATCDDRGAVPREEMEIIEIGAVMVDVEGLDAVDEFQAFVRPSRHPTLTDFCRELTTIQQAEVDAADPFPEVLACFAAWAETYAPYRLASWGDYDRKQFHQDCAHHRLPYPLGKEHMNIKAEFSRALGTKKRFGMAAALRRAGLPLRGTHHRGIDDARNIARLLPLALGRGPATGS